ncbi:MAG: hypothetical protein KKE76_11045 [Gammaproteobacteria bacterium]|nr:hypothetical protein [Gammaproteobacteria bacterium]
MFSDEYLEALPNEPLLAISKIVNEALDRWDEILPGQIGVEYDYYLECFAIVRVLASNVKDLFLNIPELSGSTTDIVEQIVAFFTYTKAEMSEHVTQLKMAKFSNKYQAKFGSVFAYEFSDGDLQKIQTLITDLRKSISESSLFEADHKQRLLARLEKIQSELHKKMSDLDRLWGLVGDAGIALGKFGKDAKPIVDRIREISEIVWRTQSRAEELPSDTPMVLISNENDDD